MRYLKGFYMAFGMFTGIPLPFHIWDEKLTAIMVSSFPLIGLVIGAIWWGTSLLLLWPSLPIVMVAAILTVIPFFVAGFIHLDGYMDTSDAHLSWRPLEEKLKILKTPTVGAFSVVMLAILFLLKFAAMYTIADNGRFLALLIAVCVMSRCCSALSVFFMRHSSVSHYTAFLGQNVGLANKMFVIFVAVLAIGLSYIYAGFYGPIVCAAIILGYAVAIRRTSKSLDGISGDLLGYAMVIGELCGLIALALLQSVV